MKKFFGSIAVLMFIGIVLVSGCSVQEEAEAVKEAVEEVASEESAASPAVTAELDMVEVAPDEELVYLDVAAAEASSFDQTPDWAPEPEPMATVDGDMLTRWSSDYIEGPAVDIFRPGRRKGGL